jgi:CHAT domain-containing protein
VLLRCCLGRPPVQPAHASPLLALGYNDQDGEEPLRYAEAEADHIARMLGGQALVGAQPKRERLLDAGRQARWLHIAGHAFYHPRDPLESELRTGAGESLSARAIASELDLDADLVTLSSCTSGIGQVVAGDEQLGLQRAFLYAGARAVLCTLWEAADFVALLLMDRFYIELQRGQPTAVALRNAQTALRSMAGQDVAATIARWSIEDPAFVAALGELPSIPPEHLDTPLYADPIWWAPFTLIGKAD